MKGLTRNIIVSANVFGYAISSQHFTWALLLWWGAWIDPNDPNGFKSETAAGTVELDHVDFTYPAREDQQVCHQMTLQVPHGTKIGLVGPSGSGKSTTIQLLERFYDPDAGSVKIDDKSLREVNYAWLHKVTSMVGQEPVLFSGRMQGEYVEHSRVQLPDGSGEISKGHT
eukprot:scaffold7793_cov390-Prasinococcus_capsulatus_cf.AAC.2